MQIGVTLPASEGALRDGATPSWTEIRDFATAAENQGLNSVWMFDHFFHQTLDGHREGMHEAWTIVSAVAAVTTRVQIGTLVLCSPFRNPGLVAKMAATADEVSGGRLWLGMGTGWHDPELTAFGYPVDHRVGRFAEALPVVVSLLRGETVSLDGSYQSFDGAALVPGPTRPVPVLVAAEGPRMLRLTARHAGGWVTAWYAGPDDRLRSTFTTMRGILAEEGRDPASLTRMVAMMVHDPDSDTPLDPDDPAVSGSADQLVETLDAYRALGVDHLIVQLLPHNHRSLARLAAAVVRHRGGTEAKPTA